MTMVYFIKPIGMAGPIKIGCSYSPDQRRKTLEFWSPFPLEIVAEWEGGHYVERQFHAVFMASHEHHEWFSWSPELQATIDAIAGGTFDASVLPDPAQLPRKKKDLSYITDGWRYERSVQHRLSALRSRGLSWQSISAASVSCCRIEELDGPELAAERARLEPLLALWAEQYPKKPVRRLSAPSPSVASQHAGAI